MGGGEVNVCNRGGSKRVSLQRSSQGSYPARPCREDGVNCTERPVDQIHNLLVWRAVQRESLNR